VGSSLAAVVSSRYFSRDERAHRPLDGRTGETSGGAGRRDRTGPVVGQNSYCGRLCGARVRAKAVCRFSGFPLVLLYPHCLSPYCQQQDCNWITMAGSGVAVNRPCTLCTEGSVSAGIDKGRLLTDQSPVLWHGEHARRTYSLHIRPKCPFAQDPRVHLRPYPAGGFPRSRRSGI